MIGIIVYIYFLVLGFLYADLLFKDKAILTKAWIGGIFGNLIMMAGIVPLAFVCGFNLISHLLLIVLAAVPYIIVSVRKKELCIIQNKKLSLNTDLKGGEMNLKLFLCLVLPIAAVICVLMFNHILFIKDGNYFTGQSTYGDLQMHMDIISSLAQQHTFPPEYNILHGSKLCYPFFIDMLSASLCIFGTSVRWAILIPSFVFAFMIVTGFYHLAYSLTGRKSVAALATVFFFLNGAFGFAYFLDGAKSDHSVFTRIFTEYYQTPTNLNDNNIRWANTICDMIIPQRTTMAGWTYVICALWLLTEAMREKKSRYFIYLGVIAGCMPMIHTHSFMALGLISAVCFIYVIITAADKKAAVKPWLLYAGIAVVLAVPQLLIWTLNQAGSEGFTQFHIGWVNENDPFIWFWTKNWGLVFLLAIPAFFNTSKPNKLLMAGGLLVFIVADLIQFQPLSYDNNKLFFVVYMIYIIVVTEFFFTLYEALKAVKLRQLLAALIIFVMTFSGVLTIIREYKSGGQYQIYSSKDIAFADFVKNNTQSDKVFMTGTYHLNPVTAIAGRSVYVGAGLFLNFHGFSKEYNKRADVAKSLYNASSHQELERLIGETGVSYIVIGPNENSEYTVNDDIYNGYTLLYNENGYKLYEVN